MTMAARKYQMTVLGAPRSVLHELRKLCSNDIQIVAAEKTLAEFEVIAKARYLANETDESNESLRDSRLRYPQLVLHAERGRAEGFGVVPARECFGFADPLERLALLARLAALVQRCPDQTHWTSVGRAQRQERHMRHQLYVQVAAIQRGLSLQLTETELAQRLGVDPSTIRRWFQRAGLVPPVRLMLWTRLVEFAFHVNARQAPVEQLALELGFSKAANVSRTLRRLGQCSPTAFRKSNELETLLESMARDLHGATRFRARAR